MRHNTTILLILEMVVFKGKVKGTRVEARKKYIGNSCVIVFLVSDGRQI